MINYRLSDKTGSVADVKIVGPGEDILVVSDDATMIRMAADSVSLQGRSTMGVRIMRLSEGSRVISIEKTDSESEEDTAGEETAEQDDEEE